MLGRSSVSSPSKRPQSLESPFRLTVLVEHSNSSSAVLNRRMPKDSLAKRCFSSFFVEKAEWPGALKHLVNSNFCQEKRCIRAEKKRPLLERVLNERAAFVFAIPSPPRQASRALRKLPRCRIGRLQQSISPDAKHCGAASTLV